MANEKRLIDVNKVINSMQKCLDEEPDKKYSVAYFTFESIIECLKQEPTVDAVEVVHGRWLPYMEEFDDEPAVGIRGGVFQTGWKCSICGRTEQTKEPYCNCGAKMDGGN